MNSLGLQRPEIDLMTFPKLFRSSRVLLTTYFDNLSFAMGDKRYLRLCADGRQEKELYHLHLFYEEYSRSISFRECCLEADVS